MSTLDQGQLVRYLYRFYIEGRLQRAQRSRLVLQVQYAHNFKVGECWITQLDGSREVAVDISNNLLQFDSVENESYIAPE